MKSDKFLWKLVKKARKERDAAVMDVYATQKQFEKMHGLYLAQRERFSATILSLVDVADELRARHELELTAKQAIIDTQKVELARRLLRLYRG